MSLRNTTSGDRTTWDDPCLLYGTVLILMSCFAGYLLWLELYTLWALSVPLLAGALVFSRQRIFAIVLIAAVFLLPATADYLLEGSGGLSSSGTAILSLAILLMIVGALRFQAFTSGVIPADTLISHVVSPAADRQSGGTHGLPRSESSFRVGELASVLMVALAWAISGSLVSRTSQNLADAEVKYRLLPQGLMVVKLTLVIFSIFLICQAVLAYARWMKEGSDAASVHLRHEIWKWNGKEQRMVARARRQRADAARR